MFELDRRGFLKMTTLGAAGLAAARTIGAAEREGPATAAAAGDDWDAIYEQFPLSRERAQFAAFFLVSHPRPVRQAIDRYRQMLDADPIATIERHCFGAPEDNLDLHVKRTAAAYLGGDAADVALTQSTTMGLALLYHGLKLSPGQEILTTTHDHVAHHEAIRLAAERSGATWRKVALFDRFEDLPEITEDAIVSKIRKAIAPSTRVLGITWVHSQTGLKLPVRAIAQAVHQINAKRDEAHRILVFVDGAHGFGVEDDAVATMGIDALSSGTHKWILGPRGTGLVWARPEVWHMLRPTIPTFDGMEPYEAWLEGKEPTGPPTASWFTPGGFHAFEHEWAVADAFAFHAAIGRPRIAARIQALNAQIKEGLAKIPKVTLYTPRSAALSAGLVGFDIAGSTADQTVKALLDKKVVASASPYKRSVARLAGSLVNTEAEVEKALAAVREVAA